jgi:UDP-N-acetylglucosamine 2-epimerase
VQDFKVEVVSTGQHADLVSSMFDLFSIQPDHVLSVQKVAKTLPQIVASVLKNAEVVLERTQPDLVIVQGDTASAFPSRSPHFTTTSKLRTLRLDLEVMMRCRHFLKN